ncbi:MAG: hypothetical protein R2828_22185 [Saprospiraceae bacterium]
MQGLYILIAIILGMLFSDAHVLTALIRPNLMIMLFFTFITVNFKPNLLRKSHFTVLAANIIVPVLFFYVIKLWDIQTAMAVLVIGLAPTAAGAPVITSFLRGKVDHVTVSILLLSPVMALLIPFFLPALLSTGAVQVQILDVLLPVLTVVFVPLGLSWLVKKWGQPIMPYLIRASKANFYIFLFNVFIASAKATNFILNDEQSSIGAIFSIGLGVSLLGLFLFKLGERLGPSDLELENSMSLGRKNTMFSLWLALTFVGPLAALGPIWYILFQNIYHSIAMYRLDKRGVEEVAFEAGKG